MILLSIAFLAVLALFVFEFIGVPVFASLAILLLVPTITQTSGEETPGRKFIEFEKISDERHLKRLKKTAMVEKVDSMITQIKNLRRSLYSTYYFMD